MSLDKEKTVNAKFRSYLLTLLLAIAVPLLLGALPATAQTILFSDDFGPKPLAAWQASPLGLLSNWAASSGAAVYNGGGHTQLYAGSRILDRLYGPGEIPGRHRQQPPRRNPRPGQHRHGRVLRGLDLPGNS